MQEEVSGREGDGPADDDDVDEELGGGELQVEGALRAAGDWKDDEKHDGEDDDAVEASGGEWVAEEKWQMKAGEDIDGGDDERNEVVEGEAQGAGAPAFFEGGRPQDAACYALKDALRRHAERCSLGGGSQGVERAADQGGERDCL